MTENSNINNNGFGNTPTVGEYKSIPTEFKSDKELVKPNPISKMVPLYDSYHGDPNFQRCTACGGYGWGYYGNNSPMRCSNCKGQNGCYIPKIAKPQK